MCEAVALVVMMACAGGRYLWFENRYTLLYMLQYEDGKLEVDKVW